MTSKLITHKVMIPEGDPPSEILLLKMGLTDTTQGPYKLNESSAKEIISTFRNREIKLFFDYNHLSLDPRTPDDGISAGWFDLELREDGIWAKNIRWTEKAFNHIKAREYAYFSPVIKMNKNGFATRLINIALTNLPATDGMEPIVSLSELITNDISDLVDNVSELLKKYNKAGTKPNDDESKTLKEIIRQIEGVNGKMEPMDNEQVTSEAIKEVVDEITDAIIDKEVDNKLDGVQMKEHLTKLDETMDHMYSMGQHMSRMMMEHSDEGMKSLYTKAHGYCMKMAEMFSEKRKEMDPHGMFTPTEKRPLPYSEKVIADLQAVTGEVEVDRQLGKIMAFKESVEQFKALSEQVEIKDQKIKALEKSIEDTKILSEKEKLVDSAIKGPKPKLFARQREWAMGLSKDQLASYLEAAPTIKLSEVIETTVPATEEKVIVLSDQELQMIENFKKLGVGFTAEQLIDTKKKKGLI